MDSTENIVEEWLEYWRHQLETGQFKDTGALLDQLGHHQPHEALKAIFAVLSRIDADPASRLFQVLAAGPLEDVLAKHGEEVIAEVEERAKADPRFKLLLGGVWQNTMTPQVWERVQACRGETW